ncbi:MAG TPA: GAF domain-containing protein [Phototrophicaceae bacterium]|nr:GAF domain-containing protein [Phototrophicaceae bacterium]
MNETQLQVEYQNAFQRILIHFATTFINLPIDQMDAAITGALRQLLEFLEATHTSINQFSDDFSRYRQIFEYTAPGNPVVFSKDVAIPGDEIVKASMRTGEPITVADSNDLPDDSALKQLLRRVNIVAMVILPIRNQDQLFGFISISWDRLHPLAPQTVDLLRVVGEVFLNALNRRRDEQAIRDFNAALEIRVAERTAELMQVNRQLQVEIEQRRQVEIALQHGESQFRAILDSLPIPVMVVSAGGIVLYVNPLFAHVFGHDNQVPSDYDALELTLQITNQAELRTTLAQQGFLNNYEIGFRATDGSDRFGLVSIQPFQFAGQPSFLVAVADITEVKRAQAAEHEQHSLTQALLDAALVLNGTLNFDEVIKYILRSVSQVVPHDVANVMIVEGEEATVLASSEYVAGSLDYTLTQTRFHYKEHYYGKLMAETKQPVILADLNTDPKFLRISDNSNLHGYLGTPIVVGQELIGFISLGSVAPDFFTETHARYLQLCALEAGIAIQNARLFAQAKTIAALEERQRLARDLHDSVTQTLFAANTLAEALPSILRQDPLKGERYLNDLHQLTRGAMAEMRSLLVELRPEAFTRSDLGLLLAQLCDVFTGRTQVEVDRNINRQIVLPGDLQMVFYRVAQEALNNTAKHAQAQHVQLNLYSTGQRVELRIRDDGQGFDPEKVAPHHLGLKIMRERAADIQADFVVVSRVGDGAEIVLKRDLP